MKRIVFIYLLLSFLSSCHLSSTDGDGSKISAQKGVLDLTGVNESSYYMFSLGGEWEFVYGLHVSPEEVGGEQWEHEKEIIRVPSTWKDYLYKGKKLPGTGIATYRLTVITGDKNTGSLAVLIPGWETAYRLFVNSKEVASAGVAGNDPTNSVPAWTPRIAEFSVADEVQELVIHITNFSHARGGPAMMPFIGTVDAVRKMRERNIGIKFFSFGGLFIISLYHLAIFLLRRKDRSSLYFSLFCMTMAIRSLVINEQGLLLFLPSISWDIHVRISYLSFALALPTITLFLESLYKDDMKRFLTRLFVASGLIYAAIIVFTPPAFFTFLVAPFQAVIFTAAVYGIIILSVSTHRKRDEARLFLGAFVFFFLCVINDILFHHQITSVGYIVPMGFHIFIFFQAIILAKRYASSYTKIEELFMEKTNLEGATITLQSLSYLDPLTGLPNRRRLDEYLDQSWRLALREGGEISLIMIDIDFFKKYNDHYGHPAGDETLKMVASTIQSSIHRPADLSARYGGEEFVVLLPGTGAEGALAVAENIRFKVNSLGIPAADKSVSEYLSISLGCSTVKPASEDAPLHLVELADQALYQAKAAGRNRVEGNLPPVEN
ncbi:MAG: diguanylate cyclase [Spirochaetales bacterium]|nr:diguanylate cyclase [Spirochaetales bacterium]